jgi:hypothetical protein
MRINNHFAVPVYEHQGLSGEIFLIQSDIKNKWNTILQDKFENPPDWRDGVKTNIKYRYNSIPDFELLHLKNFIDLHVANYIKLTDFNQPRPVFMAHSWCNITEKGDGQNWHQHQDSVISGVYYYDTLGIDGDIIFESPNQFYNLEVFPAGPGVEMTISYKPRIGKILLFPGWLKHKVEVNTTDSQRISFSFNYLYDNSNMTGLVK